MLRTVQCNSAQTSSQTDIDLFYRSKNTAQYNKIKVFYKNKIRTNTPVFAWLLFCTFVLFSIRTMAANMGSMRILIKGGKVVNDDFTQEADVYIENGIIQQVDHTSA